jgi:co-chaperonin GroES (HSP10)
MKPVWPYIIVSVQEPEKKQDDIFYTPEGEKESTHVVGTVLEHPVHCPENVQPSALPHKESSVIFAKKDLKVITVDGVEFKLISHTDIIAIA